MVNLHQALVQVDIYKKVVIRDMLCVEYKCMDQRDYFHFWTDCGCLVYCTAGKKIYSSNGEDFKVSPGSIFYMQKGAYTGKNFLDEQYCALMYFIPDSYFQEFLVKYPNYRLNVLKDHQNYPKIMQIENDTILDAYFHSVINYFSSQINKELLGVKVDELTLNLFSNKQHQYIARYFSSLSKEKTTHLKQVVEDNFASNLKLDELAELCALSLSSFKRDFQKVYGESPGKWILGKKLDLSRNLLVNTDKNVNEISFQCGFESTSHFIRSFKKSFGSTPQKFREAPNS